MKEQPRIQPAQMCRTHQALLVQQANIGPEGPWRSLIIIAQIALFQAATAHPSTYDRIGGDVTRIGELGCLACDRPDAFGEIAAAKGDLAAIKAVGARWMATARQSGESHND